MPETRVTTEQQLTEIVGEPLAWIRDKAVSTLGQVHLDWLAASPFCVLATSDAQGRCDASPKGDPPGALAQVIDDRTLALAERPGNRRVDGYRNVLANPHVGLNFFIPGRGDTLRVNGGARLVSDADFFDAMVVQGHRPILALVVDVEEVFFHCAKAFMRSGIWDPQTWEPESRVPRRAVVASRDEGMDPDEAERHYDPDRYRRGLYA